MAAPFPNHYTHRKVAESAAKSCDICYKISSSVLITPDSKDFFYVCPIHLKDKYFCIPKIDHEAIKAKQERQVAEEIVKLKEEYAEQQRKKKEEEEKKKEKKEKDSKEDKEGEKEADTAEPKKSSEEKDKKDDKKTTKAKEEVEDSITDPEEEPRMFELKSVFYTQRLQRRRHAEAAKRDRERASQPNYFPSPPTELPRKKG